MSRGAIAASLHNLTTISNIVNFIILSAITNKRCSRDGLALSTGFICWTSQQHTVYTHSSNHTKGVM
jgi:hypothetical protein